MTDGPERDDAVLGATRVAAAIVVAVLVPALVVLWGLPDRTADLWAWTIMPTLTPIFMGAGYGAGAYFFYRVFMSQRWHEVSVGVLSAAVFALLMLITTLLHFDKFNKGVAGTPFLAEFAFWGWTIVYILSPWIVAYIWWLNQRRDPGVPEPGEVIVSATVRLVVRVIAIGALIWAAVVLISPQTAIDLWGWNLTPLTARVIGCFTAQVGTGFLLLSLDPRWSSWRILVQTFLLAVTLLLVGAIREFDAFLDDRFMAWGYIVGLACGALALLALYLSMRAAPSADA